MVVIQKDEGKEAPASPPKAPVVKEARTEMLFLLGMHTKEYVQKLRDITDMRRPDFIIAEEPPNPKFQNLLEKGKTQNIDKDIEDYVGRGGYFFKEAEIEKIKLLAELHKNGTRVVQLDPGQGVNPFPLVFESAVEQRIGNSIELNDFKRAVNTVIISSAMWASEMDARDAQRATAITNSVEKGGIHGYVIVEAGSSHTFLKDDVMNHFKNSKDVKISSEYATPNEVKEVFGRLAREVYTPSDELMRLYESGLYGPLNKEWDKKWGGRWVKDGYGVEYEDDRSFAKKAADMLRYDEEYGDEREKLLAARSVIAIKMVRDMHDEKDAMRATQMVNRLGYKECEDIFDKTKGMGEEETFKYVESYRSTKK
jgi:hypothetical protein